MTKKSIYAWLDTMSVAQIVYAAKRVGVVHMGMSKNEVLESIRSNPRRSCLRQADVKHMRRTWTQIRHETDWDKWERDWASGSINVCSPSHLLTKNQEQSMMAYARDTLGMKWANMPRASRRDWP